ncbi:MAG: YggS family pyridoxal phosphate-dependent enzyme, partial [Planctomycetota bacterium]
MNLHDVRRQLRDNLETVRARIAAAARRAGRLPDEIRLVVVTKYVGESVIRELLALGVRDLGENRVQQLVKRVELLGAAAAGLHESSPQSAAPRWHMIGHLQRNKVRKLLPHVRIIHSLDSTRLAQEVQQRAADHGVLVDALIEVNVSGEASKQGISPSDAPRLAQFVRGCDHLRLRGLMTMAPLSDSPEAARRPVAALRDLLAQL